MVVYKIIPHSSVTNNTNRKLWSTLHKMYSIYHHSKDRRTWKFKGGFSITQREKDYIWFDIILRQENGKKKIEFYCSTSEIWSKKFKEIIEEKLKVTLEETVIDVLKVPEKSVIQELKYLRHDIFSMNTDAREQTTPISSILTAVDDLIEDGDFARLSVCNETVDRVNWANYSTWAHDKLSKGKIPQRNRLSTKKAFNYSLIGLSKAFNEINGVLADTMNAIQNMFFKPEDKKETRIIIENKNSLENEIGKHRISQRTHEKRNQTVWKSRIRVAAYTKNKLRNDLFINTISNATGEISEDNELQPVKIRFNRRKEIINELNTLQLSKRTLADYDVNKISSDEMSKLAFQMPTAELQRKYDMELNVNKKVETDIPSVFVHKDENEHVKIDGIKVSVGSNNIKVNGQKMKVIKISPKGLLIGHSEIKGKYIPIALPITNPDHFYRGYLFQGGMGMGKDTALQNFIVEGNLKHGISFIIPDVICEEGRRGLANGVRDSLPQQNVIDLDYSNEEYIPPLDLSEIITKLGKRGANRFAKEMVDFLNLEALTRSKRYVRTAGKASAGSLFLMKQLFHDEEFRAYRIEELKKEGKVNLANELEQWGDNSELGSKADGVIDRLDDLFGDETLEQIFSQPPHPDINFEKWMKEGKVIIIRLPKKILGELAIKTLLHWISIKVYMTRLLMSQDDKDKHGAFLVFNEPHQFMTDGLEKFMKYIALEGRKERLGSLFAFHHIGLLPDKLAKDLQAGGVNQFLFANDYEDTFKRVEKQLEPTFTVDSAMSIPEFHAICLLRFGGQKHHAFLVKMIDPPRERMKQFDNSFITLRHARMFGRHCDEVEKMIQGA
ncbi:ATP-binding protein [Schinkia azotoformans]|uniref:ATP-binding protein n=1 Tax=Schinkia azotoformans TaxID=1454 RepID=UPI002DBACAE7|nr:ATP-binding protein [Schinkia azotoformans]MEC1697775.1 ATP-binding protein [Schinkia azotoformans]